MNIETKLITEIANRRVVVFCHLPNKDDGEVLTDTFITNKLKTKHGINEDFSLDQLYEYCTHLYSNKSEFYSYLARLVRKKEAPSYYELLRKLNMQCIVETHHFALWKNEMIDKDYDMSNTLFTRRKDEIDFDEQRQIVISLFGTFDDLSEQPIVLENEYQDFIENDWEVSHSLHSLFKNTIIFVDYDPSSNRFKQIYNYVCRKNSKYPNESFLVTAFNQSMLSYGINENLTIINSTPDEFFKEITNRISSVKTHHDSVKPSSAIPQSYPYKYLSNYEESDQDIFFGRANEIFELTKRVRGSNQVTILSGVSGYGKTSLIKAGLIPQLHQLGEYDVFYIRSHNDPWDGILSSFFNGQIGSDIESLESTEISEYSKAKYQLIVIDQFEEFFVQNNESQIKAFDRKMKQFLNVFPSVSVLIAIRQDFAMGLAEMTFVDTFYPSTFILNPLSQENAIEAIVKPAEKCGIRYEENLPRMVVEDLNNFTSDKNENYVDPSQLQIVCERLYQTTLSNDSNFIKTETYNQLNRAEGILNKYIEDSISIYDEKNLVLVKSILKSLVSSKNTRIQKNSNAIVQEITSNFFQGEAFTEKNVHSMIERLVKARLIRQCQKSDIDIGYELTHEYIIKQIHEWMDSETIKYKETFELFINDFQKWNRFSTFASPEILDDVYLFKNRLSLDDAQKSFVLISVIADSTASSSIDKLRYWIQENRGNQSFATHYFQCSNKLNGYKLMLAGTIVAGIITDAEVHRKILSIFESKISPHFTAAVNEVNKYDIQVPQEFQREANKLLEKKRKESMIFIPGRSGIPLGLSQKKRSLIFKEYQIAKQLLPFFPEDERMVTLLDFYIDSITVTNRMYAEYDSDHKYREEEADYPVVGLNWEKAKQFAIWWGKDLPSEDEWEYTARGYDGRDYPWGNYLHPNEECNLNEGDKHCNTSITGADGLRPSKSYEKGKSPFGCYNMSGNVWEWTSTPAPNSTKMLVKGGSWSLLNIMPWTWYRFSYDKNSGYMNVGFRCVLRDKL